MKESSGAQAVHVELEFATPLPHCYNSPKPTMTYDDDNRLATFNGQNVTHDADGNMTYGPGTNNSFINYTFDTRNRLIQVGTAGPGGPVSYTYDPAGNRIALSNATGVTRFVVNPNAVLSQVLMRVRPGVTNYYVYGLGLLYEVTETATATNTLTYHYDYRGSTVALTDHQSQIADRFEYSAYGTLTYRSGSTDTPFLFNGRYGVQTDPNGLLYMRARYYNLYLCRFINPDPIGFSGGLNWYAYADGNPVSLIDPFGLYGNPVSGPDGPVGPSSPYAPGGAYHVPSPWKPDLMTSFMTGLGVGAATAGAVTIGAPVVVSGLTTLGMSATAAKATVTIGLYAAGAYGAYETITTTAENAGAASITGDWSPVAFNVGTVVGGTVVGVSGGGRALAESIMGQPSPAPNTWNVLKILEYEIANRYRFDLGPPGMHYWASAPTPFSGGLVAGSIGSGVGATMQSAQNNWLYFSSGISAFSINK